MKSLLLKGMLAGLALALGGCGGLEVAGESESSLGGAAPALGEHCVVKTVAFNPGEAPPSNLPPAKLDWSAVHLFRLDPAGAPRVERLNVK